MPAPEPVAVPFQMFFRYPETLPLKSAGAAMPSCGTENTKCALGEPMKLSQISLLPVFGLTAVVAKSLRSLR